MVLAFFTILVLVLAFESFGAADNFKQFLRDAGLASPVVNQGQSLNQLLSVC